MCGNLFHRNIVNLFKAEFVDLLLLCIGGNFITKVGAPNKVRTCNHKLRRFVLYPIELLAHNGGRCESRTHKAFYTRRVSSSLTSPIGLTFRNFYLAENSSLDLHPYKRTITLAGCPRTYLVYSLCVGWSDEG